MSHTPECDKSVHGRFLLNSNPADPYDFWIQRNGSVLIDGFGGGRAFPPASFCLARVRAAGGAVAADVLFCHKRTTANRSPSRYNIYYSLLFLCGAFFLLLTLLVHAAVPELRRSAYAKALMCHCASLLVGSVSVTSVHLNNRYAQPFCSIWAFVVQISFLSAFFWLNVMCFDLSWSVGAMRRRAPGAGGQRARFLLYSLYAWGCPALVVGATLVVEYADVLPPDLALLPNIGARRCWFDTMASALVFYYAPMALLLVANLVLFAVSVGRIRSARKGTSILWKGREQSRAAGLREALLPDGRHVAVGDRLLGDLQRLPRLLVRHRRHQPDARRPHLRAVLLQDGGAAAAARAPARLGGLLLPLGAALLRRAQAERSDRQGHQQQHAGQHAVDAGGHDRCAAGGRGARQPPAAATCSSAHQPRAAAAGSSAPRPRAAAAGRSAPQRRAAARTGGRGCARRGGRRVTPRALRPGNAQDVPSAAKMAASRRQIQCHQRNN